jgi:hypothetical protein
MNMARVEIQNENDYCKWGSIGLGSVFEIEGEDPEYLISELDNDINYNFIASDY